MTKGDQIVYKGKQASYVGKLDQKGTKHLIKLATGEHVNVNSGTFFTPEEIEAQKTQKQDSRRIANEPSQKRNKIRILKNKRIDLEAELNSIFSDQELEVGDLEGGTDEFEATGQHNVYGNKLNSVQRRIDNINKKIAELEGKPINTSVTEEDFDDAYGKGKYKAIYGVNEAIDLLEAITKKKVNLQFSNEPKIITTLKTSYNIEHYPGEAYEWMITNKRGFDLYFKVNPTGNIEAIVQGYKSDIHLGEIGKTAQDVVNAVNSLSNKWFKENDNDGDKW